MILTMISRLQSGIASSESDGQPQFRSPGSPACGRFTQKYIWEQPIGSIASRSRRATFDRGR